MSFLNEFEGRIGSVFGAAPQGYTEPFSFKKLAKKAAREMESETYDINGVDTAPALYTVLVSAEDDALMRPLYPQITFETSAFVEAEAKKRGYAFVGAPLVRFMVDPSLKSGKFAVFAENVDGRTLGDLRAEEEAFLGQAAKPRPRAERSTAHPVTPAPAPAPTPIPAPAAPAPSEPTWDSAPDLFSYDAGSVDDEDAAFAGLDRMPEPAEARVAASAPAAPAPEPYSPSAEAVANIAAADVAPSRPVSTVPAAQPAPAVGEPVAAVSESTPMPVASAPLVAPSAAPAAIPVPVTRRRSTPLVDLRRGVGSEAAANVAAGVAAGASAAAAANVAAQVDAAAEQAAATPLPQAYAGDATVVAQPYPAVPVRERPAAPSATCLLIDRQTGRTYTAAAPATILGRERSQCGVVLRDPNVSRRHAELSFDGSSWRIADLRSTNGTLVNDVDVDECVLRDGDVITVGLMNLEFRENK